MFKKLIKSQVICLIILLLPIFIFFSPVLLHGEMPIPADTIVGMYHPFRDVVWKGFTAGIPFKNFLITDAVRQQYPWRKLAIDLLKSGEIPHWNPYTHAGTPLLANIQTALFYPLNILYFLLPFNAAWTVQVVLQPVLLAIFMFLYLRQVGISRKAASLASLTLAFSGFSVAWLEWNTTLHTLVWLPLSLLAIEKLIKKENIRWYLIFGFSLICIFTAGFLQTSFYSLLLVGLYAAFKMQTKPKKESKRKRQLFIRLLVVLLFVVVSTSSQWIPTARLLIDSAREYDQGDVLQREDWFLPWQNLVQFLAPDFFGNPSTLNYWGVFNYMEFVGYIGIVPLVFVLFSLFTSEVRRDTSEVGAIKRFFRLTLFTALLLATPNPIAKIPFLTKIPLLSTAQPSRLMIVIDFSLVVLTALGLDKFFKSLELKKKSERSIHSNILKNIGIVVSGIVIVLMGLWASTFLVYNLWLDATPENIAVSQRNLILPTALIAVAIFIIVTLLLIQRFFKSPKTLIYNSLFLILFLLTSADLLRFAWKFTPFSDPDFLFPSTKTIEFLKSDKTSWRYMTTDRRILPPNFSIAYKMQTIEGYDPIYLKRYGQLITSAQKGEATLELTPFQRIIRPDNFDSPVFDLLNVKYVLSLRDLNHPKLEKVFQEGETRVYQNTKVFPRVFLIPDYKRPNSDLEALKQVFSIRKRDILEVAKITAYRENEVRINVESEFGGLLVLADSFYSGWEALIDQTPIEVERVLFNLRGTMISPGTHEVLYRYSQL